MEIEGLVERIRGGRSLTLEITPTHEPIFEPLLKKIDTLGLYALVDGFSITDNPLAKLRYGALFAAIKTYQRFDLPILATMSMRDRNKIALQSDILGAADFGIRGILALTGDPASMSDQPGAKAVLEGDSTLLLQIIRCLNAGHDYAGKPFKTQPAPLYPFAVSNSYARNLSHIAKKFSKKIKNYATGIITQPIYDPKLAVELLELFDAARTQFNDERRKSQLIFGFFPITRLRTAQFLSAHVPGVYVPDSWIEALLRASRIGEEEEQKVGMELSRTLLQELQTVNPRIHMMTANRFDVAHTLLAE